MRRGVRLICHSRRVLPFVPLSIQAGVMYIGLHTPYLRARHPHVKALDYFHHTPYSEELCNQTITENLGWQLPPGCLSFWRADCAMDDLKNLLLTATMGVNYRDSYLSNMVRDGIISRAEGLRRLRREARISPKRIRAVERVLGCDVKQALAAGLRRLHQEDRLSPERVQAVEGLWGDQLE